LQHLRIFDLRHRSLIRGNVLVVISTVAATLLSHAPHLRPTQWLIVPMLFCLAGTVDTARCMKPRWSWYHGGVILCLYMDLMALTLIAFCWLYPFLS
jgi:hypothetical protein